MLYKVLHTKIIAESRGEAINHKLHHCHMGNYLSVHLYMLCLGLILRILQQQVGVAT